MLAVDGVQAEGDLLPARQKLYREGRLDTGLVQ